MKRVVLILVLALVAQVSVAKNPVSILSISSSIIYFKIDRDLVGAQLEITDEAGHVLLTEVILHKKVIVDFYFKTAGKYRITVRKAGFEETFTYENIAFESSHKQDSRDEILVTQ